jgi:predicted enzyme related to lactoylglutathione lyase
MAAATDQSWTAAPSAIPCSVETGRTEEEKMAVKDVSVVSVPVADQDRAKEFYIHTLGFELRDEASMPGTRWVMVGPRNGGAGLALTTWFATMPPGSLRGLVLTCDDIQVEYESLTARGVRFEGPPQHQPWATETVFYDVDGNGIVLQQA